MVAPMEAITDFPPCVHDCKVDEEERRAVSGKPSCALAERCVSACAAYGKVCPCSARIAAHYACDSVQELKADSLLFADEKDDFVFLSTEDLVIQEKLGEGGFSHVNRCILKAGPEEGQEFAVKYLKRKAMVELHTFKHGAADLAVEARFLHVLDHPNIVKLHGVTAGSVENNFASGRECGFFIVVDKLETTLEKRVEQWRKEREQDQTGLMGRFGSEYRERKRQELMERLKIAHAIASAMEYLHSKGIVFRDLKPDNIGFDKNGVLKIFDFGLAKELKSTLAKRDGKYEMTGNTGSRRYMAPEVAKEQFYNESVDVYSFGILLWEICSAEKPFYGYGSGRHMQQVVLGGERPKMDAAHTAHWPPNLQWLMKKCWSHVISVRPDFTAIKQVLEDIMAGQTAIPTNQEPVEDAESAATESPRKSRFFRRSMGKIPDMKSISPPAKQGRARTWGFGTRR